MPSHTSGNSTSRSSQCERLGELFKCWAGCWNDCSNILQRGKWHLARVSTCSPWKRRNTELPGSGPVTKREPKRSEPSEKWILGNSALTVTQWKAHRNKLSASQQWLAAFYLAYQDSHHQPWQELLHGAGWPSQAFGSLCQCFLALRLIDLYKANPETRRSVSH